MITLFVYRITAGLALLAVAIVPALVAEERKRTSFWTTFSLWFVLLVVPVDITFKNVPGRPRFVPYIMGLPNHESVVKVKRGEVVLGGCVITGTEPKYVLVW